MDARTGELIAAMAPFFPAVAYAFPDYKYTSINEIETAGGRVVRFAGGAWTVDGERVDEPAAKKVLVGGLARLRRIHCHHGFKWCRIEYTSTNPAALLQLFRTLDGDFLDAGHAKNGVSAVSVVELDGGADGGYAGGVRKSQSALIKLVFPTIERAANIYAILNSPSHFDALECVFPEADRAVGLPPVSLWKSNGVDELLTAMSPFEIAVGPYRFCGAVIGVDKVSLVRKWRGLDGRVAMDLPVIRRWCIIEREIGQTVAHHARWVK